MHVLIQRATLCLIAGEGSPSGVSSGRTFFDAGSDVGDSVGGGVGEVSKRQSTGLDVGTAGAGAVGTGVGAGVGDGVSGVGGVPHASERRCDQ